MRRWWPVAAAGLLGLLVAGCGRPAGVDGSLINDWPPFPAANFVPVPVGTCFDGDPGVLGSKTKTWSPSVLDPVDCSKEHLTEVIFTGQFSGENAKLDTVPDLSNTPGRQAYAGCATSANAYLDGDYHAARVTLIYVPPTPSQWTNGDRYYHCDLAGVTGPTEEITRSTGTVRHGLNGTRPLAFTCGLVAYGGGGAGGTDPSVDDITATDCATSHDAEFVGSFPVLKAQYPSDWQTVTDAVCTAHVPPFLGGDSAWSAHPQLSCVVWYSTVSEWNLGEHNATVWVIVENGRKVRGSLRGIGARPLPYG